MLDFSRFRDIWRSLEPKGQLTIVAAALAILVTGFLLLRMAGTPSYTTLASGVDAAQSGEMAKALEGAGIPYKLGDGGTTVSVEESKLSAAKVALAADGLPRGSHVGFELFDKKSLGATEFQQKVDYQRALEGEIARTVEQIDGVQSAEVQLVLPEESLFTDEGARASAAVLLTGSALDGSTIRGIAHLVGSSVKGLKTDDVTITDAAGSLLWPTADSAGGGLSASSKLRAEQLYASQLSGQINGLLASTLGPGKALARVRADLSLDQKTVAKVVYGRKGTPLQTQTATEKLGSKGSGAGAAAPAGVTSNVPTYASGAGGGGESNYDQKTESTTFGVDKTVERTTVAPGAIEKLDVALVVDETVPQAQVTSLRQAVASMAGIDQERGDTFAVSRIKFATPATATEEAASPLAAATANPIGLAKYVVLGLGALVFLFVMRRGLKRREEEGIAPEPTWLREIEQATPLAELERGSLSELEAATERREMVRVDLEEIAKTQPDQVAMQVSQWLKE